MAVTINASTSAGLIQSADTSGALQLQTNGTTVASTATNGDFAFNSGYGSAATAYGCRAWVNFNGTTATPSTIRGSGNVTSVTKASTGIYTVNFTTAMPDTNYSGQINQSGAVSSTGTYATGSMGINITLPSTGVPYDVGVISVAIFR